MFKVLNFCIRKLDVLVSLPLKECKMKVLDFRWQNKMFRAAKKAYTKICLKIKKNSSELYYYNHFEIQRLDTSR